MLTRSLSDVVYFNFIFDDKTYVRAPDGKESRSWFVSYRPGWYTGITGRPVFDLYAAALEDISCEQREVKTIYFVLLIRPLSS